MVGIPLKDSGKPVKPLGVVWYETPESFEAMRAYCEEFTSEPYEVWRAAAQEALDEEGTPRVAVPLEVTAFKAWCEQTKQRPTAATRQRCVYEIVEVAYTQALKRARAAKKARKKK